MTRLSPNLKSTDTRINLQQQIKLPNCQYSESRFGLENKEKWSWIPEGMNFPSESSLGNTTMRFGKMEERPLIGVVVVWRWCGMVCGEDIVRETEKIGGSWNYYYYTTSRPACGAFSLSVTFLAGLISSGFYSFIDLCFFFLSYSCFFFLFSLTFLFFIIIIINVTYLQFHLGSRFVSLILYQLAFCIINTVPTCIYLFI